MDNLECKIERIRNELLKTAKESGMSSKETVKLSMELDHLLNLYSYDDQNLVIDKCNLKSTSPMKNKIFG